MAKRAEIVVVGVFLAVFASGIGGWLWWSSREFELPGDHWMTKGWEDARDWADDAELAAIEGKFVRPDGVADLEPSIGGHWRFVFRSRALASAAADADPQRAVPGAPTPARESPHDCFVYSVSRGSGRASNLVLDSGGPVRCKPGHGPGMSELPRCSVQQVWARAKQQGAPDPGYAEISASVRDGAWRWRFEIEGHIELELSDDC